MWVKKDKGLERGSGSGKRPLKSDIYAEIWAFIIIYYVV